MFKVLTPNGQSILRGVSTKLTQVGAITNRPSDVEMYENLLFKPSQPGGAYRTAVLDETNQVEPRELWLCVYGQR